MRTRQLGIRIGAQTALGNGGGAEILAKTREPHRVLKPLVGLWSPQIETGTFCLRTEDLRMPMVAFSNGA